MTGSIIIVGLGPGDTNHTTPAAQHALASADVIVGYHLYLELIATLAPGVPRQGSEIGHEVARAQQTVALARSGQRVALVSSGDAGVYGMAGLLYELLREQQETRITVETMPGISALNAAASLLGAPLMMDFAAISLSDRLTPLPQILRRVELATQADFILALYNPKARTRTTPFARACDLMLANRAADTPVGIVRAAYRPTQAVQVLPLSALPTAEIDMVTIIIVGNSQTVAFNGRMVTPRGYATKYELGTAHEN